MTISTMCSNLANNTDHVMLFKKFIFNFPKNLIRLTFRKGIKHAISKLSKFTNAAVAS